MNHRNNLPDERDEKIAVFKVVILAASLSGLSFYIQNNIGINLADEGYILYGVVQTAAGKVPIRNFHAYDSGRYYILEREAPMWNIYFIFKAFPEEQKRTIKSLEEHNTRWAVVGDIPLDGRGELRFSRDL